MSDADLLARLQQMESEWKNAPKEAKNFGEIDDIPDGDYQALIQAFDFFQGKQDPDAYFLKIITSIQHDAEYGGRELSRLHNLFPKGTADEREMKLGFLKQDLNALGVDVDNLDMTELRPGSDLLNSLLDVPVLMGVYTSKKKGYKNVVIRQRLDGSDLGTAQEQIAGFEGKATKPETCICPDPSNGQFDDSCPVAGHGDIPF